MRAPLLSIAVTPGMTATSSARQLSGPFSIASDSGGHGEDARIAAGHDGNTRALHGMTKRRFGARAFLPVVRSVAALPDAHRYAVEIASSPAKTTIRRSSTTR